MQSRLDALSRRIEAGFADNPEAEGLAEIDGTGAEARAQHKPRSPVAALEIDNQVNARSILAEMIEPASSDSTALRDSNNLPVPGALLAALNGSGAD